MAEMIRDADGTAICWGMGVTQNIAGSDTSAGDCKPYFLQQEI